jgi:hypothetical protein
VVAAEPSYDPSVAVEVEIDVQLLKAARVRSRRGRERLAGELLPRRYELPPVAGKPRVSLRATAARVIQVNTTGRRSVALTQADALSLRDRA